MSSKSPPPPAAGSAGILSSLTKQVSKPWFPLVIFALSVANTFLIFLSGGVTALYISTCIAIGPKKFMLVAVCNALGCLVGFTIFVALVEARGVDWVRERYPKVGLYKSNPVRPIA